MRPDATVHGSGDWALGAPANPPAPTDSCPAPDFPNWPGAMGRARKQSRAGEQPVRKETAHTKATAQSEAIKLVPAFGVAGGSIKGYSS